MALRLATHTLLILSFSSALFPPALAFVDTGLSVIPLDANNSALAVMACGMFCATLIGVRLIDNWTKLRPEKRPEQESQDHSHANVALTNGQGYSELSKSMTRLREQVSAMAESVAEMKGAMNARYEALRESVTGLKSSLDATNERVSEIAAYVRDKSHM